MINNLKNLVLMSVGAGLFFYSFRIGEVTLVGGFMHLGGCAFFCAGVHRKWCALFCKTEEK